jgi:hypothetical protein
MWSGRGDPFLARKYSNCGPQEFYERFQAGQTGDAMDYVEWASLVQMVNNLTKRLRLLRGEASE